MKPGQLKGQSRRAPKTVMIERDLIAHITAGAKRRRCSFSQALNEILRKETTDATS